MRDKKANTKKQALNRKKNSRNSKDVIEAIEEYKLEYKNYK